MVKSDNKYYYLGDEKFDRVTSVLSMISYSELKNLAEKTSMNYVDRIMKKAAEKGTNFHYYAQMINSKKGSPATLKALEDADPPTYRRVNKYLEYKKENIKTIFLSEKTYYHQEFKIAGTPDLSCLLKNGGMALIDYKTTSMILPSHIMQMAAYNEILKTAGHGHDKYIILYVSESEIKAVNIPEKTIKKAWNMYLYLLSLYRTYSGLLKEINK